MPTDNKGAQDGGDEGALEAFMAHTKANSARVVKKDKGAV